jgi:hypothetical protein
VQASNLFVDFWNSVAGATFCMSAPTVATASYNVNVPDSVTSRCKLLFRLP